MCFYNGSLTETLKKQNLAISESIKSANIQLKTINRKDIKEPYWGLYYEDRLISRADNPDEFKNLTTSPLREKIATELMSGKLCVMVYLKSDNKEKDEKGLQSLHNALATSPFGKII